MGAALLKYSIKYIIAKEVLLITESKVVFGWWKIAQQMAPQNICDFYKC